LGEVVGEEFEDGAEGWSFLEVEAEGGGVEADEVGASKKDFEPEVLLVEAGGGAEVRDLEDDLGGSGHWTCLLKVWENCRGGGIGKATVLVELVRGRAKCRDLVHTRSRRSAIGRIGY
jgi:hypothetical protein